MTNPWRAFELVGGHCAIPSVWEPFLGTNYPAFKILCLQATSQLGSCIRCPNCKCTHRIIPRDDRSGAIAVCRCQPPICPDIPLTMEQATLFEINRPRLGRAIARALGCPLRIHDLPQPSTLQFGSWSSESVPLILTLQSHRHIFRRVITELGFTLGRPYILFAPTNLFLDAGCQQLLAHARAAFFPLDATVTLTPNGTLEALRPADELFAALTPPQSKIEIQKSKIPPYSLQKGLRAWSLSFDGKTAPVHHERGIFYTTWLLYNPPENPIHSIDLMAKVPEIYRLQLGLPVLVDQTTGKAAPLQSGARLQERSLALDDAQAMRALYRKQRELENLLDSDGATEPEKNEALRELEQIYHFQKHNARRSKDSAQRVAEAVRKSISRFHQHLATALDNDGNPHPVLRPFAAHLEKYLLIPSARFSGPAAYRTRGSLAGCFTYEPPPGITWQS